MQMNTLCMAAGMGAAAALLVRYAVPSDVHLSNLSECSAKRAVSARASGTDDDAPTADPDDAALASTTTTGADDASAAFDGMFEVGSSDIPPAAVPRKMDRAALEAAKRAVRPHVELASNQSKTIGQRVLTAGRSESDGSQQPRVRGRCMFYQSDAYADAVEAAGLTGDDDDDGENAAASSS